MLNVVGLDIGGANTKAAFMSTAGGEIKELRTATEYFPFWKKDTKQLCDMLLRLKVKVTGDAKLHCIGVTMTAELSDAYRTKREGVNHILDCITNVFADTPILVATVDATLEPVDAAKATPLKVAAANWAATGWMVSRFIRNCVVVDVGSTTTSIIPIIGAKAVASGNNDLEKLMNGELVYTGGLRTNVAGIVNSVPVKDGWARVSSELFAQSADVHLVVRNIRVQDYSVETPDGKGKAYADGLARLARVVCADTEMLSKKEILKIARHVYEKQLEQIAEALNQVYSRLNANAKETIPVIVTGLGRNFLAKKAAVKVGVNRIIDIIELMPESAAMTSPAVAVAFMTATKLEGRSIKWTL